MNARTVLPILPALLLAAPAPAADAKPDLSGISLDCQAAEKAMRACLQKTLAAGAPDSIRGSWEKQISDSVQMWRHFRGQEGVEKSCKEIAAKKDCEE